jgi:hypothetical protein
LGTDKKSAPKGESSVVKGLIMLKKGGQLRIASFKVQS